MREREKRLVIICVGLLLHYLFECNKYQYPQRSPVIQFRCCYYYCHCRLLLLLLNAEEKETAETKMITFIFFKLLSQFIHQHAHKTTQHKSFYCNARHGIIFIFANVLILMLKSYTARQIF